MKMLLKMSLPVAVNFYVRTEKSATFSNSKLNFILLVLARGGHVLLAVWCHHCVSNLSCGQRRNQHRRRCRIRRRRRFLVLHAIMKRVRENILRFRSVCFGKGVDNMKFASSCACASS